MRTNWTSNRWWVCGLSAAGLMISLGQAANAPIPGTPTAPQFTPPGGVFSEAVSVQLAAQSGEVRYTTDGSDPSAKSARFTKPLALRTTTLVKARVFEPGKPPGPVRAQTYILRDPDAAGFVGNLPLVIIHTFGHTIERHTKQPARVRFIEPRQGRAWLSGAADFDGGGLISYRGNSSLRYLKRSYAFKTLDDSGKALNASILGFPADSDWILYAPYPDKTLMRDVLAYELFNQMGHYASRTRFVEVFVNEEGGRLSRRHYMGVFVLEEKIKRGKDRVAIVKLGTNDQAEPNITGGYIFKKDHADRVEVVEPTENGYPHAGGPMTGLRPGYPSGPGGFPADPNGFLSPGDGRSPSRGPTPIQRGTGLRVQERSLAERVVEWFRPAAPSPQTRGPAMRSSPQFIPGVGYREMSPGFGTDEAGDEFFVTARRTQFYFVEPKQEDLTAAQKRWLLNHLNECERVLYGPSFGDPAKGYAAYLDADTFIDQHLMVEVTKNIDGFRFSTFFTKDRGGKIRLEPIWDWNLSFGNANGKQGWLAEYWYWPQLDDQQYSWYRRLFEDPDFGQRYVDRWGALRTNIFSARHIQARIDALAAQLGPAQRRNFERWPILGKRIWPNYYVGRTYEDEVSWMKDWIARRLAWIDRQFVPAPNLNVNPATLTCTPTPGAGKIYFTVDGADPRQPGGSVSPKARTLDGAVKLPQRAKLVARTLVDQRWSPPVRWDL